MGDKTVHELRTSLTVMKEGLSLVLDEVPGRLNKKQREILIMVKKNIDRFERAVIGNKKRC